MSRQLSKLPEVVHFIEVKFRVFDLVAYFGPYSTEAAAKTELKRHTADWGNQPRPDRTARILRAHTEWLEWKP